jgi:hypothetical protein
MEIPAFKLFSDKIDFNNANNKMLPKQEQPFVFEGIDMEMPKLVFLRDNKDFKLPFKIDETGLARWFKSLNHTAEAYVSCQQVYQAIRELNGKEILPQLRFTLLDFIAIAVVPIVKNLEKPILETKIPLPDDAQSHQELITALYALLAHGFSRVAQDIFAFPEEKRPAVLLAHALFSGLEALQKVLLHTCEAYGQLHKGYWSSCYRFYRCADRYELLDFKIMRDTVGDVMASCNSVGGSFKSLLLFYLSGPNQCKPKDMKTLFKVLDSCAPYATVHAKIDAQKLNRFFSFSLDQDAPPVCLNRLDAPSGEMRYLETVKIAKVAYDTLNKEAKLPVDLHALKRPELVQLVKNLGMGSHRKFIRAPVKKNYAGIIGYDHILHFLRNPGSGGNRLAVEPMDPRRAIDIKVPDFELVPLVNDEKWGPAMGWQKIADDRGDNASARSIWMQADDGQDENLKQFEIVNSNVKGYGMMLKDCGAKVGVGEFVGIFIEDDFAPGRCEVGIIRRISQAGRGVFSLGVELLAAKAEAVCVYRTGNVLTKKWAVLLRGIKAVQQPDSLIYSGHVFSVGDDICLEQGNKNGYCRINKLLHCTPNLTHAELLVQR